MTMREAEQAGRQSAARVRDAGGATEAVHAAYYAAIAAALFTPKKEVD